MIKTTKYGFRSISMKLGLISILLTALLLAACGGDQTATRNPATEAATAVPSSTPVVAQPTATSQADTSYPPPAVQVESEAVYPAPGQAGSLPSPTAALTLPLALTPAQTEGPYYPVNKPADTDNDLTIVAGSDTPAAGEVLLLSGRVLDVNAQPIAGVTVQIWQTDSQGIYLHPDDPKLSQRDPNFQSYGESLTGADGSYGFKTILPGLYEPRPRHIHVKVVKDGETLLTTQFYFTGDERLANDPTSAGVSAELTLATRTVEDESGNPALMAQKDIVLP